MIRKNAVDQDNRDAGEMYEYLEARIDALKRRVAELEADNEMLRLFYLTEIDPSSLSEYVGHIEEVVPAYA